MKDDRGTAFSGDQGDEKCNKYSVRKHVRRNHLTNSVALVRERTTPTERPPPVGEVSANFCG